MKRIAALVLVVALMLPCAVSLAENLCEKEIHFAEFQFGMRYEDVRAQEWVNSIEYRRHILPTRVLCDTANEIASILYNEMGDTGHFAASLEERDVAGHRASVKMYFTYKDSGRSDGDAILYAGLYEFYEGDGAANFRDLKSKLSKVYGEPYAEGEDAAALWGALELGDNSEHRLQEWNDYTQRTKPNQYVVWKSAANGVMVVLRNYLRYGDFLMTDICYVWPEADQYFDAMYQSDAGGASANDLNGL